MYIYIYIDHIISYHIISYHIISYMNVSVYVYNSNYFSFAVSRCLEALLCGCLRSCLTPTPPALLIWMSVVSCQRFVDQADLQYI